MNLGDLQAFEAAHLARNRLKVDSHYTERQRHVTDRRSHVKISYYVFILQCSHTPATLRNVNVPERQRLCTVRTV